MRLSSAHGFVIEPRQSTIIQALSLTVLIQLIQNQLNGLELLSWIQNFGKSLREYFVNLVSKVGPEEIRHCCKWHIPTLGGQSMLAVIVRWRNHKG